MTKVTSDGLTAMVILIGLVSQGTGPLKLICYYPSDYLTATTGFGNP